jgi:deoxyribodipyrimidine photo-lyase
MSARGFQVDAHNVVPVWEASPKLEVGARTIRKKIHDRFGDYLVPYPEVTLEPNKDGHDLPFATNDWDAALAKLQVGPPCDG